MCHHLPMTGFLGIQLLWFYLYSSNTLALRWKEPHWFREQAWVRSFLGSLSNILSGRNRYVLNSLQAKWYNSALPCVLGEQYILFLWDSRFALVHHFNELDYLISLFDQAFATTCNTNPKNRGSDCISCPTATLQASRKMMFLTLYLSMNKSVP